MARTLTTTQSAAQPLIRYTHETLIGNHKAIKMTQQEIIETYESGALTWGDLLEVTGLPAHVLYSILFNHARLTK